MAPAILLVLAWGSMRRRQAEEQLAAEAAQVRELLDPYTDRTYVEEPGSAKVAFEPGKMFDKLRERMERVVLDPLDIEVAVEDFLTYDEVSMLLSTQLGDTLVTIAAEHAADLLAREFPAELATKPILSYDTRAIGLDIADDIQALARDILNSQTSQDLRGDLEEASEQVRELNPADQVALYIAVLALYLRKLNLLASATSNP